MREFALKRGLSQVRACDRERVEKDLMAIFKVKSQPGFYLHVRGLIEPKFSQKIAVDQYFAAMGITDIWGDAV